MFLSVYIHKGFPFLCRKQNDLWFLNDYIKINTNMISHHPFTNLFENINIAFFMYKLSMSTSFRSRFFCFLFFLITVLEAFTGFPFDIYYWRIFRFCKQKEKMTLKGLRCTDPVYVFFMCVSFLPFQFCWLGGILDLI